ncbi:MAG: hypothetical protein CL678_10265 [Bdellovibrionaceae bacterium]|nr:hypothetical protein [Pseudobdellovibrionaceae bacterium]
MSIRGFWIFIFILSHLSWLAHAGQKSIEKKTSKHFIHKKEQSDLYKDSVNVTSVQLEYLQERMELLKEMEKESPSKLKNELGLFCYEQDARDCFKRYERIQALQVQALRARVIRNQNSAEVLRDLDNSITGIKRTQQYIVNDEGVDPQKTEIYESVPILTFSEMQALYQEQTKKMEYTAGEEYQKWAEALPESPREEDFILYKEIKSSDPKVPPRFILDKNCVEAQKKGYCVDPKYFDVLKKWQLQGHAEKYGSEELPATRNFKFDSHDVPKELKEGEPGVGETSRKAYGYARSLILSHIEKPSIKQKKKKSKKKVDPKVTGTVDITLGESSHSDSKSKQTQFEKEKQKAEKQRAVEQMQIDQQVRQMSLEEQLERKGSPYYTESPATVSHSPDALYDVSGEYLDDSSED